MPSMPGIMSGSASARRNGHKRHPTPRRSQIKVYEFGIYCLNRIIYDIMCPRFWICDITCSELHAIYNYRRWMVMCQDFSQFSPAVRLRLFRLAQQFHLTRINGFPSDLLPEHFFPNYETTITNQLSSCSWPSDLHPFGRKWLRMRVLNRLQIGIVDRSNPAGVYEVL